MTLASGTRLGSYEVVGPIGAGGMGEVYRAHDVRLDFESDPDSIYVGLEPQAFDDAVHGRGLLVIGWRVDGRVDVYERSSFLYPMSESMSRGLSGRAGSGSRNDFFTCPVEASRS